MRAHRSGQLLEIQDQRKDMRNRGLEELERRSCDPPLEERILRSSTWQCVGRKLGLNGGTTALEERQDAGSHARETLQEFKK